MIEPSDKGAGRRKGASPPAEVSSEQARKTALVVSAVLFLLSGWNFYRGRMVVAEVLGGIAALLMLVGFFVPVAARAFHRFWMGAASALGYINSRILLSVLYYGILTPYGLISRLVRDPLGRRSEAEETYWVKRSSTKQTKEQFERLF